MSETVRRPGGVTFLVVLIVIGGVLDLLAGIALLVVRGNPTQLHDLGISKSAALSSAVAAFILGLVYLLVARGLSRGGGFSRFLVAVVSVLNVIGGVWAAFAANSSAGKTGGVVSAVIGLVVLLILYGRQSNEFFRST